MKHLNASFWQPPDDNAIAIKATRGCSWNKCTFCALYKGREFSVTPLQELEETIGRIPGIDAEEVSTVFLGEGNALAADVGHLKKVLALLRAAFPRLRKIGINSTVQDALKKQPKSLRDLRAAGLTTVYIGIESGHPKALAALGKGTDPATITRAGRRIMDAGLTLCATVLIGAGGRREKAGHIEGTAALLKAVNPHVVAVRTLTLMPGTPLFDKVKNGEYTHPTPIEGTIELRRLIAGLDLHGTILHTRHNSNIIQIAGRFPEQKEGLLAILDSALSNPADEFLTSDYFRGGS